MSNFRGRIKRLERDAAATAAPNRARVNVFDALLSLMLGHATLDDINPDDQPVVERL